MRTTNIRIPLLATLILLTVSLSSKAQSDEKVWSFGPEVGVNFSKLGGDGSDTDYRSGILVGLGLTYSIQNTYGITTKVLYSQKGYKDGDTGVSLKYIEVPITGRFFLNREGTFRPNIFVGPSFNFLTGVATKIDGEKEELDNWKDSFNAFDFGVTGGLGLNWLIADETHIIIDGRYTHGLSDISKADGKVNNQAFTVSAGITFGL